MQKQAPSVGRIMTMILFALSCFGLLLYLWVVFGGPTPLRAKGYRVTAEFPQAGQLAQEADVRISGVPVGRVKSIRTNSRTGVSDVVLEIDRRYAPIPNDTRLRLRTKTLLGETYVEMTPGDPTTRLLPDGGHLRRASISPSVQLDEIISTFDAPTRRAFQVWMQEQALATAGRGRDISDTIAQFAPLEEQATELLKILNDQAPQLTQLVSGTGQVFAALSARSGQLTSLIRNSNTVFSTIGKRDKEFAAVWVAFPTFQRETRRLLTSLHGFVNRTDPLVTQLTPAFHELSRTLVATDKLSPDLLALVTGLGSAQTAGVKGLPAVDAFLGDFAPFLGSLEPSLANLNPFLQFVGAYRGDLAAFFANSVAATNQRLPDAADSRGFANILRAMNPLNPETLAPYPDRLKMNRPNAYYYPRATLKLNDLLKPSGGPPVYDSTQCASGLSPVLAPETPALIGQELTDRINKFIFGGDPANVPAPRCILQGKFTASGRTTSYPQIFQGVNPPPLTFGR